MHTVTTLLSRSRASMFGWMALWIVVVGPSISHAAQPQIACEVFRLENGLTVVLHRDPESPGVSLHLTYRVGSANEQAGATGVAHFLEHLMFEGSANVPSGAFDAWLEGAGGRANAATGEDFTTFWQDIPPGALELALFLESDRMAYLAEGLDASVLEQQRAIIEAERQYLYDARPYAGAEWAMRSALYPADHPYATPVIGKPEDVADLTVDHLADFYRSHYHPANAALVVAGPIEIDSTLALANKWFSSIPPGEPTPVPEVEPVRLDEDRYVVVTDAAPAAKLALYWPSAKARARGEPELFVLADLIGGSSSSRLEEVLIRERNLATSVDARQESLRHGGLFSIEVVARPGQALDPVLRAVDEVLGALMGEASSVTSLGKSEVRRSVAGFTTEFLARMERVGGYRGLAGQMSTYWVYLDDPDFFARDLGRYRGLNARDVRSAARRWLDAGRVVVSVVPHDGRALAVTPREDR
jgi:zinc protease